MIVPGLVKKQLYPQLRIFGVLHQLPGKRTIAAPHSAHFFHGHFEGIGIRRVYLILDRNHDWPTFAINVDTSQRLRPMQRRGKVFCAQRGQFDPPPTATPTTMITAAKLSDTEIESQLAISPHTTPPMAMLPKKVRM